MNSIIDHLQEEATKFIKANRATGRTRELVSKAKDGDYIVVAYRGQVLEVTKLMLESNKQLNIVLYDSLDKNTIPSTSTVWFDHFTIEQAVISTLDILKERLEPN